jgi:hypothetical protein
VDVISRRIRRDCIYSTYITVGLIKEELAILNIEVNIVVNEFESVKIKRAEKVILARERGVVMCILL